MNEQPTAPAVDDYTKAEQDKDFAQDMNDDARNQRVDDYWETFDNAEDYK